MVCILIHGVPDTPALWEGLVEHLDLSKDQIITPALPGFITPLPKGFNASKQAYVDWLIALLEAECAITGPVDLVGHDWGAILCLRAAHLRPDLIKSWAALNAVILPGTGWHRIARLWQKPVVGEILMFCMRPWLLRKTMPRLGMPKALTTLEVPCIGRDMKRAILRLYRSAITVNNDWGDDLENLPRRGMVIWGDQDPFMPLSKAKRFCIAQNIPLHVEKGAGHWTMCENPRAVALPLKWLRCSTVNAVSIWR